MTRPAPQDVRFVDRATRRATLLTGAASGVTLVGVVLAVAQPAWLTQPLQALVESAGTAAPMVYVLLCALVTPLHLGGVLVALSPLTFSIPLAITLSFLGVLLGSLSAHALLVRLGGAALRDQAAWPAPLRRLAAQSGNHPTRSGVVAWLVVGGGLAVEAFFLFGGVPRRSYWSGAVLGMALYVTQTVLGVTLLHVLFRAAPGLAGVLALSPLLLFGVAALGQRRRKFRANRS